MLNSSPHPVHAAIHAGAILGTSAQPVRYINCLGIAAGGSNIFRFLGAIKELRKRNLRPKAIHTVSAGGPTGAVIAADVDPDLAVELMLGLLHRRLDSSLLIHSLVNSDFQRLLLSGGTSWSPRQAYTGSAMPSDLTCPKTSTSNSGLRNPRARMASSDALESVQLLATPRLLQQEQRCVAGRCPHHERHRPRHGSSAGEKRSGTLDVELIVDGAVWNFIPRLVGPSIVIKAKKLTDLGFYVPKGIDVFNPSAWMRSAEEYRKLFKLPMDFVYQWLEVNMPLAADRRHVGQSICAFLRRRTGRHAQARWSQHRCGRKHLPCHVRVGTAHHRS